MKYVLTIIFLMYSLIGLAQNNKDRCPPGFIMKEDYDHVWKCMEERQNALPVELLYFRGEQQEDSVILYWSTVTEKNNNYFELLGSDDGSIFYYLNTIYPAFPNSSQQLFYKKRVKQYKYYRMIQVDLDNKSTYSPIVFVQFKESKNKEIINKYDLIGRQVK